MLTISMTLTLELERPTEWLRALSEGRLYRWLLEDAGNMAVAAYRLARARCRVQPVPTAIPTLREVIAAARAIEEACGEPMPPAIDIADECEARGLMVISPLRRRAA